MAVIRIEVARDRLLPTERFGLDLLVDLSRLLVAEQAESYPRSEKREAVPLHGAHFPLNPEG